MYKLAIISALVASASAFAPVTQFTRTTAIHQEIGKGGMADTRDPEPYKDEDPRKSISAAPSFEEYLKQRQAEVNQPVVATKSPAVSTPPPSSSMNNAAPAKSHGGLRAGGMADTRDPDVYVNKDPRKSISAAPSFEEYMNARK